MPPRARPSRRTPPNRSARALVGALAMTGLIVSQSIELDASLDPVPAAWQDPAAPATITDDSGPGDDSGPSDSQEPAPLDDLGVVPTGLALDDTEIVARLERIIRANREELEKQKALLDDGPESGYPRAEKEYEALSERFEQAEMALEDAIDRGEDEESLAGLREGRDDAARLRDLAKTRFELAIRERRVAQEQIEILSQALASDENRLRELLGEEPEEPAPATPTPADPADATPPIPAEPVAPTRTQPDPAPPATASPIIRGLPTVATDPAAPPEPRQPEMVSEEVTQARREVETKAEVAAKAERRMQSLDERLALIDRKVETVREQLANAQLKADNARETRTAFSEEFRNKSFAGAPQAELRALRDRIDEAEAAARQATLEVRDRTARLEAVREERDLIVDARESVFREATEARLALEMAEASLQETVNPFSPRNLRRWAITRGPGLLTIVFVAALLIWLINRFGSRVASIMAQRGTRGSLAEREDRAKTLISVFETASTVAIVIGAGMMALDFAGVPIAPLLGGAAVLGLAISFGAQNLVSDFFYGFMILLENQYKLNDVVRINEHSGSVERITLRMTALRDLEGSLHFIPNGQITSVVNKTHGWSRALFDVGVAYKEDVDRVMEVLIELGKELRQDPKFRPLILEDPTMLGVDAFADSAVMIKFFIKTRPLQQWAVRRELNRRIKNRFDALGIEIPFPHRTVYHRTDDLGPGRLTIEAHAGSGDDGLSNGDPLRG